MLRSRLGAAAFAVLATVAVAFPATAEVETRDVTWKEGDTAFEGQLVIDRAKAEAAGGKLPAVLVVHQWMGPSDDERARVRMLAELGYAAFVADIYGTDTRPKSAEEAGAAAGKFKGDRPLFRKRLLANYAKMLEQAGTDRDRTAAIGYCFGGTGVLELARAGADIDGVVSFHGGLDSTNKDDGRAIRASVLVLHGAADPYVPRRTSRHSSPSSTPPRSTGR